ncbi:ribonucleotide reductase, alpha subunit, partial [mine drainage metagenome]
ADRIEPVLVEMSESVERPECLRGTTYKIKTPVSEHAMYVTLNDMVLNEGSEFESRRPFEIFINSKNLEHYQWIVALTRVISAVFRKGGDVTFLAEELQAVFDPKGGYWQKGKYMPSLVAELGSVLDKHMRGIGMIQPSERALAARKLIAEKRGAASNVVKLQAGATPESAEAIPPHAVGTTATSTKTCPECGFGGLVQTGGCEI